MAQVLVDNDDLHVRHVAPEGDAEDGHRYDGGEYHHPHRALVVPEVPEDATGYREDPSDVHASTSSVSAGLSEISMRKASSRLSVPVSFMISSGGPSFTSTPLCMRPMRSQWRASSM